MHQPTDRVPEAYRRTVDALASWIENNLDLLQGLVALRDLGADGDEAADRVAEIRELKRFRLSLELFELLAEDAGFDARKTFEERFHFGEFDVCLLALYGRGETRANLRRVLQLVSGPSA